MLWKKRNEGLSAAPIGLRLLAITVARPQPIARKSKDAEIYTVPYSGTPSGRSGSFPAHMREARSKAGVSPSRVMPEGTLAAILPPHPNTMAKGRRPFFCLHQDPWRAVIVIQSSYYGILPHYKRLSTARIIQTLPAKAIMTSRMPWKTLSRTKRATGRETTSPTNAPGIPQSAALTTTGVYSPAAA